MFRPKSEVVEDVGSTFDDLIRVVEDKLSSPNDILSELKSKEFRLAEMNWWSPNQE